MLYNIEYSFYFPHPGIPGNMIFSGFSTRKTNIFATNDNEAKELIAHLNGAKKFPEDYKLGSWRMVVNLGVADIPHHANFDAKHLVWKNCA